MDPIQTTFPTPPNLHSDDYAGTIGKRYDEETGAAIAGWIYDCNPHGHMIRPFVPPHNVQPYAQLKIKDARHLPPQIAEHIVQLPCRNAGGTMYTGDLTKFFDGHEWQFHAQFNVQADNIHANVLLSVYDPELTQYIALASNYDFRLPNPIQCQPPNDWVQMVGWLDDRTPLTTSQLQMDQRAQCATCNATWKAMTAQQREVWTLAAKTENHYHRTKLWTGYNLFMRQCMRKRHKP